MITSQVTNLTSCKKGLKITVPVAEIDKIREVEIGKMQKNAEIQGFRRGKAPRSMVLKLFQGAIERNTIDHALQHGFEDGLRENNIVPVGDPVVKKFDFDQDKNLLMEIEVETYPDIELKKYKGLKVEKEIYSISDDDVEESIHYILHQKAIVSPVDGKAENGHFMTLTMQELDAGGVPLVGKKYENIRVQLGSGEFDPDIEHQLTGLGRGDEKIVEKIYPKDFEQKQFAGKMERYRVTVAKTEKEELPVLDDDFVQTLNYGKAKTVGELRDLVRKQLEMQYGQRAEEQFYHRFAHELLQNNPFEVPEAVVERYLDEIVSDVKQRQKNVNEEELYKAYRPDAVFNVKWFYLKEKIAEAENLRAEKEDFDKYIETITDEKI
jgi:trigger factor